MEEKIRDGKVEGVTDPAQAKDLVRKGHYTYDQAVKIAKAGNWESLKFDIRNQAGASATAGAISAAVTFASAKHQGATTKEAFKASGIQAGKTAGKTMVTGGGIVGGIGASAGVSKLFHRKSAETGMNGRLVLFTMNQSSELNLLKTRKVIIHLHRNSAASLSGMHS